MSYETDRARDLASLKAALEEAGMEVLPNDDVEALAEDAMRRTQEWESTAPRAIVPGMFGAEFRRSSYWSHAVREMELVLKECEPMDVAMQVALYHNILKMLEVFHGEHHSGSSADFARYSFSRLSDFKPLTPLTGEEWEWGTDAGSDQNKRCSHVFRRADGTAYDIRGKVFVEPNGAAYTSSESTVEITFPYVVPERPQYVKVDEDGKPLQ